MIEDALAVGLAEASGCGQWLHAKNRLLAGERPIDLLAEERGEAVRGAAEAFIDGSYV